MLEWLYRRFVEPKPVEALPRAPLTVQLICREAVSTLLWLRRDGREKVSDEKPLNKLPSVWCGEGQYGVAFWIPGDATRLPLERFTDRYVLPAMIDLCARVPADLPLVSWTDKQIPQGVEACAEEFSGVAVRCVLMWYADLSASAPREWRTRQHYYDVNDDEWKEGEGAWCVRFDVQTKRPPHAE
jgi:hypothetical protein